MFQSYLCILQLLCQELLFQLLRQPFQLLMREAGRLGAGSQRLVVTLLDGRGG